MKTYVFSERDILKRSNITETDIRNTLHQVAEETDTDELVVSIYVIKKNSWAGGTAYAKEWMTPESFRTQRGRWKITGYFDIPRDLPRRFKLIRLLPLGCFQPYPKIQKDNYGWEYRYETFMDHLALLFAHELHHYRRYHLGLHPGEGEKSANRWALAHVQLLGYRVQGYFADKAKESNLRRKRKKRLVRRLRKDPYKSFLILDIGSKVFIKFDPHGTYENEIVVVERRIRTNSKRMVVRTADGKIWRWPMDWLQPL